ncbi:hypothetical protein LVD15_15770 [Fulvivirga maritima]|uniref:arsenate reductase family protein n=1 Tax=Fulvivirga maritima TaxID=2904247 RepID=UPI001F282AEA|nr:hypothetical protein [Fulvivirga maritima]UII24768.1 hypothetical protein LVD15_15770 [Fulvivirga maritima]
MKAENNEILFFFNSEKQQDRKARGYADTVENHQLNEKEINKDHLTETQIAEIADDMGVRMVDLIDKNSGYYLDELKDKDISDSELATIMAKNPEVIKTPIAYMGSKAFFVEDAYSLVQQGLEMKGVQSDKGNVFEKSVKH